MGFDEDVKFIEDDLLPEMVHNRCFCDSDSREFVEFDSAKVEALKGESYQTHYTLYRAEVIISFSGEPKIFHVIVKLLPDNVFDKGDAKLEVAYDGFLNEEIIWNKARLQYGKEYFPKFYVADMGRYGRPVVVVEDLEKNGYYRVKDRELSIEEGKALMEYVGKFHGKGMNLKENKFSVFREFFAKFQEITFAAALEEGNRTKYSEFIAQLRQMTDKFDDPDLPEKIDRILTSDPYNKCKTDSLNVDNSTSNVTICQGLLIRENLWFNRNEDNDKISVIALDWQRVRYSSNTIDLATILSQCRFYDWKFLMQDYVKAVQIEQPTIEREQLELGLGSPGFLHAFLLLSLIDDFELPPLVILYSVFAYDFNEK